MPVKILLPSALGWPLLTAGDALFANAEGGTNSADVADSAGATLPKKADRGTNAGAEDARLGVDAGPCDDATICGAVTIAGL